MRRRPRPIATLILAALIAALLTACGGPTGTPDPTGPGEREPEPYWEMTVTSGDDEPFEVAGAAVAYASANVIVLGESDPPGWSVSFTITGELPMGFAYFAGEEDLLNATVGTPAGSDCVVTPASTYAELTFVTVGLPEDEVPTGLASVVVEGGCGTFSEVTGFAIGFGVQ